MAGAVVMTGNVAVDIVVHAVEEIPWGKTALVNPIEQHLGGNGGNCAYALATLGREVRLIATVGQDALGDFALERLRSAGVDLSDVGRSPLATATTIAVVNRAGARGFLHHLGISGEAVAPPELFSSRLAGSQHYHVAGPFRLTRMRGRYPELLRRARAAGLSTSLDTQWDPLGRWMEDLRECLPLVNLLFVNEDEARHLCGTADSEAAAKLLREAGAGAVVVKLGAQGCCVTAGSDCVRVPAFPAEAIDTTGAGDSFCAGFLAEYLDGRELTDCASFANAVAGMSVERLGGTAGVRSRAETLAWMRGKESQPPMNADARR